MALSGEIMKYVGNELVSKEAEKGLSKVADKAASSALSNILSKEARNVGTSMLDKATGLGLSKNAGKWVLNTGILDTDAGVSQVKDFMKPILGEDTPNYKRLLEQIGEGEYQMAHRPNLYLGDSEVKFPLSNMEADPDFLPKIYGDTQQGTVNNLLRLGNTGEEARRSANIIAQYQNQPDKMVKVYRQAPKDMNYGDWVGLTPEYANFHEGNSPENRLWEREVPASEVMFAGDDINEWGYYPKEVQLDDELGQALDLAIQNTGVDENAAMRAMGYITNDFGRLADKSGKPVKFYHSTPNEFSEFDNARLGDNTGYSNTALGHFVTEDKDFSSRFRDINNEGNVGTTMELQAKVKNPVIHPYMAAQKYSDPAQLDRIVENYYKALGDEDTLNAIREYADEDGVSLYDAYMDNTLENDPFEFAADERNALMNNGYDAVEIVEGPRNGLVKGATEDTPVSSLAVLDGKNLRRTTNIPVSKADATGVNIDIRRGAGDAQRLIDADRSLSRLQNSPARGMLGNEQIQAYKRALNGENLSDEFLKNDKFARVLDEEVSKRPLLITPEQEADPSLIDPKMLSEFEGTARKFINQNLDGVERGRKAVIVLGRPSSGKSSGAVNLYTNKKGGGFFELDNDEIKKLLPGYDDGMGANAVHNASSLISKKMVLPELADNGYNIVLPIVGKKESSVMSYVDELANRGYEIAMINTNLPVEKCRTRNRTRAYETGRNVADAYLVSVGEKPDLVYNSIKEKIKNGTERRIGSYAEVSTDVPFGEKAILVENSGGELLARLSD